MHKALFYTKEGDRVQCHLCPHECQMHSDQRGICQVRYAYQGELFTDVYGIISSSNLDPIEKKPLYNFMPGSQIFSIGSIGCNLKCSFCQNWQISTYSGKQIAPDVERIPPRAIVEEALQLKKFGNIGVAYTYNEPTVWYEYMKDIALRVKEANMVNVVVSNGYINPEPLRQLIPLIDAFNIDLKGCTPQFFKDYTQSTFSPVINTLTQIVNANKHLEIAYLVIPQANDDAAQFERTIADLSQKLSGDFTLHINRYFPAYHLSTLATPLMKLEELAAIARKYVKSVFIGNI